MLKVAERIVDVTPERAAALKALGARSREDSHRSCDGLDGAIKVLNGAGPCGVGQGSLVDGRRLRRRGFYKCGRDF